VQVYSKYSKTTIFGEIEKEMSHGHPGLVVDVRPDIKEQFGPILHVYRYSAQALDKVISDLNRTGYGLTLGIHSRNEASIAYIEKRLRVGNCYINRNQVGAVVGCQPFGGRGLSGTGPKAGGPNYLKRFATERVRTTNTSAIGGNSDLLSS
jgi:RHH-type proline utilization regulon transcriptional repressor/proline dehydrogenase/delta 1-pyrroline-5-carboxylate dehydrogenase